MYERASLKAIVNNININFGNNSSQSYSKYNDGLLTMYSMTHLYPCTIDTHRIIVHVFYFCTGLDYFVDT